jgi:phosphatidylserine/phosphatidylglycerophosphate/cardiolipin synthase-like enzyme
LAGAIGACQKTLDIAIFSFYSQAVADAVIAAKNRGVTVRVVGDVSQARRSPQIAQLVSSGADLRLSSGRGGKGVLHHKFAILDGEMAAAGSFNFSQNAEKNNFENQFYLTGAEDLAAYQAEYEAVWAQAHSPAAGETPGAMALR